IHSRTPYPAAKSRIRAIIPEVIAAPRRCLRAWPVRERRASRSTGRSTGLVDRLRIVVVADICPAADRASVNFHHVPLVAAARPPDLSDRAKHLLDSANVGEPQGSPQEYRERRPASRSSATRAPAPSASPSPTPRPRSSNAGATSTRVRVTIGDVVSPLWTGQILVAANPRRAMPSR